MELVVSPFFFDGFVLFVSTLAVPLIPVVDRLIILSTESIVSNLFLFFAVGAFLLLLLICLFESGDWDTGFDLYLSLLSSFQSIKSGRLIAGIVVDVLLAARTSYIAVSVSAVASYFY